MIPAGVSTVDVSQIPKSDVTNLCRDFLAAVERFYEDPENVRRYDQWEKGWRAKNGNKVS